MPTVDVLTLANEVSGQIEIPAEVFSAEVRLHLLHETVRWQLAKRRAGTHKTKTRREVAFSTKKLYRQKGTGQARRGSRKAPGLRKGGIAHGPLPRDYSYELPKRVRREALRSALAHKFQAARLKIIDSFALEAPKTKPFVKALDRLGVPDSALLVDAGSEHLGLASRNVPRVDVIPPGGLNVYDILRHEYLLVAKDALPALLARFGIVAG